MTATITGLHPAVRSDALALADTKLVLGNWYAECVINARSLPDFAALLGMSAANYGHTRAIYQLLAGLGDSFEKLERGRQADGIFSAELLDQAPQAWEDFLAGTWLGELATWTLASRYLQHENRTLAGIARKIGQEAYFHLKYASGWVRVFSESAESSQTFRQHLARRLPLALQWFGHADQDAAFAEGETLVSIQSLRSQFLEEVNKTLLPIGETVATEAPRYGANWRADARRNGALPAGLFEVIRFKHPELAH